MDLASSQNMSQGLHERATATVEQIKNGLPDVLKTPKVAIVCGSGLGGLADTIDAEPKYELPYADIPGFTVSTGMLKE